MVGRARARSRRVLKRTMGGLQDDLATARLVGND